MERGGHLQETYVIITRLRSFEKPAAAFDKLGLDPSEEDTYVFLTRFRFFAKPRNLRVVRHTCGLPDFATASGPELCAGAVNFFDGGGALEK